MNNAIDKNPLLANFHDLRVIQRNSVYIHGLNYSRIQTIEIQVSEYGPFTRLTTQKIKHDFYSAFVSFEKQSDAASLILKLNNSLIDEHRYLRVYYGSTKFCPQFLYNKQCKICNCNYAHYYDPLLTVIKGNIKNIDHQQIAKSCLLLDEGSKHQGKIERKKDIRKGKIKQQIEGEYNEWGLIDKQILEYVDNGTRCGENHTKSKIQLFLDEAETKLLELIFKFSIY